MSYATGPSIFGRVSAGVANPLVPHTHPWPTRYHGSTFVQPQTSGGTYREQTYAHAPYMGLGCGCSGAKPMGAVGPDGLGKLIAFGSVTLEDVATVGIGTISVLALLAYMVREYRNFDKPPKPKFTVADLIAQQRGKR